MKNSTSEMIPINLTIDKCYRIFDNLSSEKKKEFKEEIPELFNAMESRNEILHDSKLIDKFLEKFEPIFEQLRTIEDFRKLSKEQTHLFKNQSPELYEQTALISNVEVEIISLVDDFKNFDDIIKIYGSFEKLIQSALISSSSQNPKISFNDNHIKKLTNISKFILFIEHKSLEENVLEIQKLLFETLYIKDIIRLLVELSFYNFKYEKEIDISYIQLITDFFLDLFDLIELAENKLKSNIK